MINFITKNLSCLLFCLFSISMVSANNGDPIVKLCSGKEMSWDEYLMFKRLNADEYDIELESFGSKNFTPFKQSFVNNSVGAWSSVIDMPLVAIAGANLPNGKLMTWSARDKLAFGGNQGRTWTAIFDPANNSSAEFLIENTQHDMFCPGVTTLPDGRVMATGGSSSNKSSIYDPFTGGWSTNDALNIPRGYQSQVTLASGATFTIGGSWSGGVGGKDAEAWSEKAGWFRLPGLPVTAITEGTNSPQPVQHDDYFPWLFVAPNGKLFHAGPSQTMHWIDAEGRGSYTSAGQRGNDPYSINGTTVMYDIGKILKVAGAGTFEENTPANGKSYIIDINNDTPQVTEVEDLNYSRNCHNSVVLPNGEVVVFGGMAISNLFSDNDSRLVPELFDPVTQTWTDMAPMATPRNYHSIALLLSDGRIFVAGGGLCNTCSTNHPDAEIFSPPYLFNSNGTLATRPVINFAPPTANYNSTITANMNSGVSSFALVRNSAVTHSTNNEQRRIPVAATNLGGNQYQLSIPNKNILPPGNYMLFAMNAQGTPSLAKFIQIGDDINNCDPQGNPNPGGSGLEASYYNSNNLTSLAYTQTDANVDFDWGTGGPAGVNNDNFSVRWTGSIEVPRSGTYTFYTNSDDGVRLWVNGKVMVDNWTDHGPTEDIAMIHLEPNTKYDIQLEYYEAGGGALIQLSWTGPGILKEIIPSQNLFPPVNCTVGTTCNDNDPCTTNDVYDNNCNCAGTFQDDDNDGVCNANDVCPNLNDNLIGSACDDGNPNTTNDVYQSDCSCAGTPTGGGDCGDIVMTGGDGFISISGLNSPITQVQVFDPNWSTILNCAGNCDSPTQNINNLAAGTYYVKARLYTANWGIICDVENYVTVGGGGGCTDNDNDGICANQDCNDNDPNLPATVGSSCNDGNPNTNNDVIQSDGCTCAGTPTGGGGDCNDIVMTGGDGFISVSGLNSPITQVQVFDPSWSTVLNCAGNCDSPTQNINNLAAGTYYVKARLYTSSWSVICDVENFVTVGGGGGGCTDNDNDGVCANQDCNDNDPNLPATVGSSCNDGNSNTNNDVIQSDGCTCAGTPSGGGGDPCDNIAFTFDGSTLTATGLDAQPISILQIFNSSWQQVFKCAGDCNGTETLSLPDDTYFVKASLYTSSWSPVCNTESYVSSNNNYVAEQDPETFYFSATKNGRHTKLYWVTNTEYKNDLFEIERSLNGTDFETINQKTSENDLWNMHANYSVNDYSPKAGVNYYRIKKLHRDGTEEYSPIRELVFDEEAGDFTLFPNPARDEVFVHLTDFIGETGTISIYNSFGKLITERAVVEISGEALRFSTRSYTSGLYVVVVRVEDRKVVSRKLVIAE
ncbi:MAG: PA14 domain-containing protein [Saprospiraceae bacterium]